MAPHIEGAVNLAWKIRRGDIWEARWQAPRDVIDRGFFVKSVKLWAGPKEPMPRETSEFIRDTTLQLEDEMTKWLREQSS